MKNKILILLSLLFLPLGVKADSLSLSCSPDAVLVGDTITCSVNATTNSSVEGIGAKLVLSNGLSFVSYSKNSSWENGTIDNLVLTQYGGSKSGTFNAGTLKVKVNTKASSYKISFNNIEYSLPNYVTLDVSATSATVAAASDDNNLSSLTISGGTLSPEFNPSTTTYTVNNYTSSSITINANASSKYAVISGTGTKNVSVGSQSFKIIVTAQNKETKTYTINVNRIDNRSTNNNLASLSINKGTLSPSFNASTTTYTVNDYVGDSIIISASAVDTKATMTGTGTKKLNIGSNIINVIVTAENGSKKTYRITVNRIENKELNLKSLIVTNTDIVYSDTKDSYTAVVADQVNSIDIQVVPLIDTSVITGTGVKEIVTGRNIYNVVVKASNGESRTIIIVIFKNESNSSSIIEEEESIISKISVENFNIDFKEDTYEYKINVDHTTDKLIINYPSSDNYTVNIEGNENLSVGENIVTIMVTNNNSNETESYRIIVHKNDVTSSLVLTNNNLANASNNNGKYQSAFYILLGLCLLETIALIYIFIQINKNRSY